MHKWLPNGRDVSHRRHLEEAQLVDVVLLDVADRLLRLLDQRRHLRELRLHPDLALRDLLRLDGHLLAELLDLHLALHGRGRALGDTRQRLIGLRKNAALFFEFFLYLSRACLGEMIIFIYKWRKKWRFSHRRLLHGEQLLRNKERKRPYCECCFPPCLSRACLDENDHFLVA